MVDVHSFDGIFDNWFLFFMEKKQYNYIKTYAVLAEGKTTESDVISSVIGDIALSIQYFDSRHTLICKFKCEASILEGQLAMKVAKTMTLWYVALCKLTFAFSKIYASRPSLMITPS